MLAYNICRRKLAADGYAYPQTGLRSLARDVFEACNYNDGMNPKLRPCHCFKP